MFVTMWDNCFISFYNHVDFYDGPIIIWLRYFFVVGRYGSLEALNIFLLSSYESEMTGDRR